MQYVKSSAGRKPGEMLPRLLQLIHVYRCEHEVKPFRGMQFSEIEFGSIYIYTLLVIQR